MTLVFWCKKQNLSDEAIKALSEIVPDMRLVQLGDVSETRANVTLDYADIIAFQRSSLPIELDRWIRKQPKVLVHEVDFNTFEFKKWEWLDES